MSIVQILRAKSVDFPNLACKLQVAPKPKERSVTRRDFWNGKRVFILVTVSTLDDDWRVL